MVIALNHNIGAGVQWFQNVMERVLKFCLGDVIRVAKRAALIPGERQRDHIRHHPCITAREVRRIKSMQMQQNVCGRLIQGPFHRGRSCNNTSKQIVAQIFEQQKPVGRILCVYLRSGQTSLSQEFGDPHKGPRVFALFGGRIHEDRRLSVCSRQTFISAVGGITGNCDALGQGPIGCSEKCGDERRSVRHPASLLPIRWSSAHRSS